MPRHGSLQFGYQLSEPEWQEIKQLWSGIDFDPYEPDWRERWAKKSRRR